MNKKQLIELLKDVEDDTELLVSSDEEGNSFNSLEDVSTQYFAYKEGYEYYLLDDDNMEEVEDVGAKPVVVFWP